jgi:hypothetical protein
MSAAAAPKPFQLPTINALSTLGEDNELNSECLTPAIVDYKDNKGNIKKEVYVGYMDESGVLSGEGKWGIKTQLMNLTGANSYDGIKYSALLGLRGHKEDEETEEVRNEKRTHEFLRDYEATYKKFVFDNFETLFPAQYKKKKGKISEEFINDNFTCCVLSSDKYDDSLKVRFKGEKDTGNFITIFYDSDRKTMIKVMNENGDMLSSEQVINHKSVKDIPKVEMTLAEACPKMSKSYMVLCPRTWTMPPCKFGVSVDVIQVVLVDNNKQKKKGQKVSKCLFEEEDEGEDNYQEDSEGEEEIEEEILEENA